MLERSFRNLLPSPFQVGKLEAQNLSSSQPLNYHILRLTINYFRQKGIQLHIQSKQSHPYGSGRVNFEMRHLPTLQPQTEYWGQGIHFPHFWRCRTVSHPTKIPRILQGKNPTFIMRQTQRQQIRFPKTLLCESSQLPCGDAPSFSHGSAELSLGFP